MPWVDALFAVMAGAGTCHSYGLEGSALWLTLATPRAERADGRGTQWAFLPLSAPVAMVYTVVLTILPAIAVVFAGLRHDSVALQWAGLPVGITTGAVIAWWCGRVAIRQLTAGGTDRLPPRPPFPRCYTAGRDGKASRPTATTDHRRGGGE